MDDKPTTPPVPTPPTLWEMEARKQLANLSFRDNGREFCTLCNFSVDDCGGDGLSRCLGVNLRSALTFYEQELKKARQRIYTVEGRAKTVYGNRRNSEDQRRFAVWIVICKENAAEIEAALSDLTEAASQ